MKVSDMQQNELPINQVVEGDCLEGIKKLPDNSINCIMTSPPYWGLRNYGEETVKVWGGIPDCEHEWGEDIIQEQSGGTNCSTVGNNIDNRIHYKNKSNFCQKCGAWKGQLGLEPAFEMYISHLCDIFDEAKRKMRDDGTLWVNLGDTYATHTSKRSAQFGTDIEEGNNSVFTKSRPQQTAPEKCLCQIPSRFAIEMVNRGWILRNEVIWYKRNCLGATTPIYAKSCGHILRTSIREIARLPLDTLFLMGNNKKWRKVIFINKNKPMPLLSIHLRNGMKIMTTYDHLFPIGTSLVRADELGTGMKLEHSFFPDVKGTSFGKFDIGYFVGMYLAEGSKMNNNKTLQFVLHPKETHIANKIKYVAKSFNGSFNRYIYSDKMVVHVSGIPCSIIDFYVDGYTSKYKHLSRACFNENNSFLKGVLNGYLDGDGYYEKKNDRWRLGFTVNRELEYDLRVVCNRLGYHMRAKLSKAKIKEKEYPCIRGEIRKKTSGHFNQKDDYEIKHIIKTSGISYEIGVDGNHLFLLADGTVTHNCMPSSISDRFTVDFEKIYFFTKKPRYWFERQIEPMKADSVDRYNYEFSGNKMDAERDLIGCPQGKKVPLTYSVCTRKRKSAFRQQDEADDEMLTTIGRNKRCVWDVTTKPFKDAHFATFPEELVETPIKAGCPKQICLKCGKPREKLYSKEIIEGKPSDRKVAEVNNVSPTSCFRTNNEVILKDLGYSDCGCNAGFRRGIALDPFMGSGTLGVVAAKEGVDFIGFDINPKYCEMARKRIKPFLQQKKIGDFHEPA